MGPDFLTYEDVLELHAMQLERFGGSGLLRSALAMPQATFDGQYLHDGLFPMAAAYLFHWVESTAGGSASRPGPPRLPLATGRVWRLS